MALMRRKRPALLVLEDGSAFPGYAFAGSGEVLGEVVFNTGMTGYQEILSDPSYKGQIVAMTYPLIGSYGTNPDDMESAGVHMEGFIVKEYQNRPSNWRSTASLKEFLESHDRLGVEGIDTRALTRRLRVRGALRGVLSTETTDVAALVRRTLAYPGLVGRDLVKAVTCGEPYLWNKGAPILIGTRPVPEAKDRLRVVVLDCGVKYNILRQLEGHCCQVIVVPATTTAAEILAYSPRGVLLSNGPGDPAALPYVVETAKGLLGRVPIFGICLGHQILGQALGGKTGKLKFGHHGLNQPVRNRSNGRVEITSQNHGFVVLPETLSGGIEASHGNLNDRTSEGMNDRSCGAFSVQYHPEAAPGPHDANYLFAEFVRLMNEWQGATA